MFNNTTDRLTYRTVRGPDVKVGMRYRAGNVIYSVVDVSDDAAFGRVATLKRPGIVGTKTMPLANHPQYRIQYRGDEPVVYQRDVILHREGR